jgi:hypothetical protein
MGLRRDPDRERQFLRKAGPGAPPYGAHACRRLATGKREYGNSWATRGLPALMSEILEECADVGAWAALAVQALDHEADLDDDDRETVADALLAAARYGALAYARIGNARRLLETEQDLQP